MSTIYGCTVVSVESVCHKVIRVEFLHDCIAIGLSRGSVNRHYVLLVHPSKKFNTVWSHEHTQTFLGG